MSDAPKVSLKDVEAAIVGESYTLLPNGRTTVCQLTLDNGFTVEGQSACVSVENYNEELGNKFARERAVDKVWQLLGFRLADQLKAQAPASFFDRLLREREELVERIGKLGSFLDKPHIELASTIGPKMTDLLAHQLHLMNQLADTLDTRISLLNPQTKH